MSIDRDPPHARYVPLDERIGTPYDRLTNQYEVLNVAITGAGATFASEKHPERNEDEGLINNSLGLYAVFDGVSGSEGSQQAAQIAADAIDDYFQDASRIVSKDDAKAFVAQAVEAAHDAINRQISRQGHEIVTTAVVTWFFQTPEGEPHAVIVSAGDSRAGRICAGESEFEMLTLDHSRIRSMEDQQILAEVTSEEDEVFLDRPDLLSLFYTREGITSWLGGKGAARNIVVVDVQPGDRFLLTSDGVHDNLTNTEIEGVLFNYIDNSECADMLVGYARARARKGVFRSKLDDMSAILVDVEGISYMDGPVSYS